MSTPGSIRSGRTWWPRAIAPDYALSSHVAPLGMTFTYGSAMPARLRERRLRRRAWQLEPRFLQRLSRVVYVPFQNGVPSGMAQDVVTGFIEGYEAHAPPRRRGDHGNSALLVADDAGNTVWRVAAADGSVTDAPMGTDRAAMQTAGAATGQTAAPSGGAGAPAGLPEGGPPQTDIAPATKP